jgi:hypothetical protein
MVAKRVHVYIDGSNFFYGCQDDLGRTDVDFEAFVAKLVGDREHRRTY